MAQKKKLSEKIDKRYRGRVRIGEDAKGKPVYKYISGKTKAELENNRKRVKEYYASGAGERKDMLFEDFAEMWIESKVTKVKPTTATGLRSTLKKHLLPGFSGRRLKAINSLDIQMFIDAYEGVRKGTLDDVIYCLRQLFRYAKVHRYITENPTIDIERPKTTAKKIRALDPKYYEDVERIAREHEEGLLIGILFYTGVRRGEALGMKWEDVDFAKRRISVKREVVYVSGKIVVYEEDELEDDLKSEAAQRSVPIPTELLELLIKNRKNSGIILSARNGYYLSDSTYRRRWDRLMEYGGFPVGREKTVVGEKGKIYSGRR